MNLIRHLTIRSDDVCAFLWSRANQQDRARICTAARLSDGITPLDWFDLQIHERLSLIRAITAQIETNASRQRQAVNHEEATA